jgi:transcriptional regulator with XRE-family HTH domain
MQTIILCRKENRMKIKLDTKKIYLAMAEKGLTATEIARQGGVSQQAVSNALNGNRVGRVKVVPAICKALDFSAKDIVIIED